MDSFIAAYLKPVCLSVLVSFPGPFCNSDSTQNVCLESDISRVQCFIPLKGKMTFRGSAYSQSPLFFHSVFFLTLCHLVACVSPCVCVQMCDSLLGCLASTHYHISFSPPPLYPIFFPDCFGWMDEWVNHERERWTCLHYS